MGASGSGKTYTLVGNSNKTCESDGDIGLIGRVLCKCLSKVNDVDKLFVSAWEISPHGIADTLSIGRRIQR